MKQLSLIGKGLEKRDPRFGGSLLKGNNPKVNRPLSSKFPIHSVLKAKKGGMLSPHKFGKIKAILDRAAKRHGVRLYQFSNVGNHIHLLIRLTHVRRWNGFIREVTSLIAVLMGEKKYWLYRPFTRIISGWRKAYEIVKEYLRLNDLEVREGLSRDDARVLRKLQLLVETG